MKNFLVLTMGFSFLFLAHLAQAEVLAEFDSAQVAETFQPMQGVNVTYDPSAGGKSAVRVENENSEPLTVPLATVNTSVGDCVLMYFASFRSEDLSGQAYLEMLCVFPDGQQYFSRAMNDALSGNQKWKMFSTPFFLEPEDRCEKVILGVRFEGPGTVWVDDIRLEKNTGAGLGLLRAGSLIGAVSGMLIGLWGMFVGLLASKGKARGFVMTFGVVLLVLGLVLMLTGLGLAAFGAGWMGASAWLMAGFLDSFLMVILLPVARNAYRRAEEAKMQARDLSETVSS